MPEPRYVQRDPKTGALLGHFANPQPYAQERVPEDHPDILKWNKKREEAARGDGTYVRLMERIETLERMVREK